MKKTIVFLLSLFVVAVVSNAQNGPVNIWEGTLEIPSYRVDAPETAPSFEREFGYQGAKRGIYPYALNDNLTNIKVDTVYRALYLENDYIKVCVLPDIGGRLFYATDKTDGYEIFYHQHVIKPADIGMLGAWISGGVEWNVFHHHRATSHSTVDFELVDNGDGSKTIWVGEVERRHRMSWAIGMTLYPDKSYIEITGRLFNDSPNRNSILHWNNVATHTNNDYQIIFPENTEFGTYHSKRSFLRWPIPDAPYRGEEGFIGKDVSYWRNLPTLKGESVFAYDLQDDFIGGYDYGKNAGTILAGNHNINKGGKFWSWGNHRYGHLWDSVTLTDEDGPYVELMRGAYSDNQPDYSWIDPYETKEFTEYWYGIRDLQHVNRANEKATVNMDIGSDGHIHLAANVTQIREDARIVVRHGDRTLFEATALIAPDKPFAADVKVDVKEIAEPSEVIMYLYDNQGNELINYHPYTLDRTKPLPDPVQPLNPDPKSVENNEELYYFGMRNLQFHNAYVNPNDYFEEVLARDSGDVRSNTQLGIYYRQQGEYDKAAHYLRTALKRQTANQTRVSDGESMYNLGLVLKAEGKYADAIDTLYRAVWDYGFASSAYYQLAEISSIIGNTAQALKEAEMSINYNGMNVNAKNLYTSLLRHEGRTAEAVEMAENVIEFDPINHYALYELVLLGKRSNEEFAKLLHNDSESYLELAVAYLNNGCVSEASSVLAESEAVSPYPTVEYYQGYLADLAGDEAEAGRLFGKAASGSIDYVFPYRLETVKVYEKALEYMPESAVTYYYMGNLYFQKQPAVAMECWRKAVELKPDFVMALRNLGWGERYFTENLDASVEWYRKAIAADKDGNAIFLTECDEVMELANYPLTERHNLFAGKKDIYEKRYGSMVRAIRQMILAGEYEETLDVLTTHFFIRGEGTDDLHDIYVDACLLAAFEKWGKGENNAALKYALMANEYPENHGYAHLEYYARDAQIYYNIGLAYERVGDAENAGKYYKMATEVRVKDSDCIYNYEKGLAMKKLNDKADVKPLYEAILNKGKAGVTSYVQNFFGSGAKDYPKDINTRAYYMQGIGHKGLGDEAKARECFKKALSERNDNLWANYYVQQ